MAFAFDGPYRNTSFHPAYWSLSIPLRGQGPVVRTEEVLFRKNHSGRRMVSGTENEAGALYAIAPKDQRDAYGGRVSRQGRPIFGERRN